MHMYVERERERECVREGFIIETTQTCWKEYYVD